MEEIQNKKQKKRKKKSNSLVDFLIRVLALGVFIFVLFFLVIGIRPVNCNDMIPQLKYGDLVLFYRLENNLKATDIVVYEKDDRKLIGRIVATAGDTVTVTEQETLVINGSQVMENEIYFNTPRYDGGIEYPVTLRDGEYFILGDYREAAMDSRYLGIVTKQEIDGVVLLSLRRQSS